MDSPDPSGIIGLARTQLRARGTRGDGYIAFWPDSFDYSQFYAYLECPDTGIYCCKLIKLHVRLSRRCPWDLPQVRFPQDVAHLVHPNLLKWGRVIIDLVKCVNLSTAPRLRLVPLCALLVTFYPGCVTARILYSLTLTRCYF